MPDDNWAGPLCDWPETVSSVLPYSPLSRSFVAILLTRIAALHNVMESTTPSAETETNLVLSIHSFQGGGVFPPAPYHYPHLSHPDLHLQIV